MKKLRKLISAALILAMIMGCFIPFSATASAKKIVYSNKKGSAKVVCGKFKKTFNAKNYKNKKGEKSFARALNEALKYAGKKATDKKKAKVTISKGYYTFDRTIRIYSNTELVAKGCVTKYLGNQLCANFDKDKASAKGYKGARNITVTGGTWNVAIPYKNVFKIGKTKEKLGSCTFRFAHCKNLVIRNATFIDNYTNHDIELGGVDGATIYNCNFYNTKSVNTADAQGTESVQIDICYKKAMPNYPSYDYTPCKNITVKNNTFKNKLRAVGSHHAIPGKLYDNIQIYGNKMTNIGGITINGMYWTNSRIYNNTMTNVGAGIDLISFGDHNMYNENKLSYSKIIAPLKKSRTYIYGNTVSIRKKDNLLTFRFGVRARGTDCSTKDKNKNLNVPNNIYYLYNTFLGTDETGKKLPNKISGAFNSGVDLRYAVESRMCYNNVNMNGCDYSVAYGLFIDHCQDTDIWGNKAALTNAATTISRSGATIRGGELIDFTENKINVTDYGIQHIYGPTRVYIHNNDITSSRSNCVYLSGKEDPTPDDTKKISIVDNDLNSPDNDATDASIKIIVANIEVTAHSNGDVLHWFRGSENERGLKIKEMALSDISLDSAEDMNYLDWVCETDYHGFKIYRYENSDEKVFVGDTTEMYFEDRCGAKEVMYEVVPYAVNANETIYGEPLLIYTFRDDVEEPDDPVSSEDNPVSSEENPISSEDNPISSEDNPVSSEDNPVSSEDNPVSSEDNPVSSEDNPISSEDNPSVDDPSINSGNDYLTDGQGNYYYIDDQGIIIYIDPTTGRPLTDNQTPDGT